MHKYDNLKNGQKYFFEALYLLFISDQKIQTMKIKI